MYRVRVRSNHPTATRMRSGKQFTKEWVDVPEEQMTEAIRCDPALEIEKVEVDEPKPELRIHEDDFTDPLEKIEEAIEEGAGETPRDYLAQTTTGSDEEEEEEEEEEKEKNKAPKKGRGKGK